MERNTQKNGIINFLALLVAAVAAFAVARYSQSLAGLVGVVYLGLGALVAAISWFQMRLETAEAVEKLELEELARSKNAAALFESKDSEALPAQRSREQFEKWAVPFFTVLIGAAQAGAAYYFWHRLSSPTLKTTLNEPMTAMFIFLLVALILFILGRFSATYARLENNRLLRPGAGHLLLNAIMSAAVGIGIVVVQMGFLKADLYVAYALSATLALVAIETLVTLVLEIYRPRLKGRVERPLYESRLVGLLGQPEGLITTAAQAIDYQFGFKVSETWFYRFFERALAWLVPLQLALLLLTTCAVVIDTGEKGLLEHFGRPAEPRAILEPGLHFKWPWPIDRVYRHRTEQIQSFTVGSVPEDNKAAERVVLWTVSHSKEENFLVANRDLTGAGGTNQVGGKRTPPVSLLTVSVPVQYQVTNLLNWVYKNEDAPALMQDLATREIVRYLATVDMQEIMSHGRMEASAALVQRIQQALNERELGARILSVGLQDLHPPVKVAPDYEKVVSATQSRKARILAARADEIRTNALASARAVTLVNQAVADSTNRVVGTLARAALFTNQIPAFAAAPDVYAQRAYLDAFVRATADARKYVLLTTNTQEVITIDLQDKIREDLLNLSVPAPKK